MKMNNTKAIEANKIVHSSLAKIYNETEPHYNSESILRVEKILNELCKNSGNDNLLDLGCGTGFIIDIAKKYFNYIKGVDVTKEMTDRIDKTGKAMIEIELCDTGKLKVENSSFNVVTAYSFLDHLFELKPTFINAYKSLKPGGAFYADLMPNRAYWELLKRFSKYSVNQLLEKEINKVIEKPNEIEKEYGIKAQDFINAEHQKHVKSGMDTNEMQEILLDVGFNRVEFVYHWFIGEAQILNKKSKNDFSKTKNINNYLTEILPISSNYFKYVGFIAYK